MTESNAYLCIQNRRCIITVIKVVFCIGFLSFSNSEAQVVLSEIMFDPAGSEQSDEFIEIVNLSETDAVDLNGWKISDGDGEDSITDTGEGMILLPRQYGLILDADYFEMSNQYDPISDGALVLTVEGTTLGSGGLSNSRSESVSIMDASGYAVSRYAYSTGNQPGFSDEKIDLDLNDDPENWSDSRQFNGTPGCRNSIALYGTDLAMRNLRLTQADLDDGWIEAVMTVFNAGKEPVSGFAVTLFTDSNRDSSCQVSETIHTIYIEDILASGDSTEPVWTWRTADTGPVPIGACLSHPDDENSSNDCLVRTLMTGVDPDAVIINEIMPDPAAGQAEWVELYNTQNTIIDLTGWAVSDRDTANPVVISEENTLLAPESYVVLSSDSSMPVFYSFQEIQLIVCDLPSLNNEGDAVILFDPLENMTDQVHFNRDAGYGNGVSLERISPAGPSDIASNWHASVHVEGGTPGFQNSVFQTQKKNEEILTVSPNPFSPDGDGYEDVAVISYQLPSTGFYSNLRIFDMRGRCIRILAGARPSGFENIQIWDGMDDRGRLARVGIYIVHMEANGNDGSMIESKTALVLARRF